MPDKPSSVKKIEHWIRKHPLASAIIGIVAGAFIYLAMTRSQAGQATDGTSSSSDKIPGGNITPEIIVINEPPVSTLSPTHPGHPLRGQPIKKHKHKHKKRHDNSGSGGDWNVAMNFSPGYDITPTRLYGYTPL